MKTWTVINEVDNVDCKFREWNSTDSYCYHDKNMNGDCIEHLCPARADVISTNKNDTIQFAMYLTGHDEATIRQMYDDWKRFKKPNKP